MEITSLQNEKVKYWVRLKEKKFRDQENLFLVEGNHLVEEAKKFGYLKETISCNRNIDCDYLVTKEIIKKISTQVSISETIGVCEKIPEKAILGPILILDNLQDPGNLGTIIRSAVAFCFKTILLSTNSVDLYNEKVIRSTEGMIFQTNVIRCNIKEMLLQLKAENYRIYGTNVVNGKRLKEVVKEKRIAVIIGSEGKGMSPELKELTDGSIYIPMSTNCESLNAGVSASIIMYELGELHNGMD